MLERTEGVDEDEVDEEALTDIEVPTPAKQQKKSVTATPSKGATSRYTHLATPPSTKRTKRIIDRAPDSPALEMVIEESEDVPTSPVARKASKAKNRSPFDDWPRSKSGSSVGGKKREASEAFESAPGSSKRTRSGAMASPA